MYATKKARRHVIPSQMYPELMMLKRMRRISPGAQFLAEPTFFIPLLSNTFPSGANRTINKMEMYVFRCRPAESFIRFFTSPFSSNLSYKMFNVDQSPGERNAVFFVMIFGWAWL